MGQLRGIPPTQVGTAAFRAFYSKKVSGNNKDRSQGAPKDGGLMRNPEKRPITQAQIRYILRASSRRAQLIRRGLIALLAERTKIPNLPNLSTGALVRAITALERKQGPLGAAIQSIIAPVPIKEPESHAIARRIMKRNFLGLSEVTRTFGPVDPTSQDILATIPFDTATLWRCRKTHMLVADIGLSIIDVRECMKRRNLFHAYEGAQYNQEEFANRTDGVAWRLIRKTSVKDSMGRSWDEQKMLLGDNDGVPTSRQMVYTIMLTFATTGKRLFQWVYVRTNDVDSNGQRVCVGGFDSIGLTFINWYDSDQFQYLGISSSRK